MAGMSRKDISVFLKSGMDMTYFIYFMDISDCKLNDYFDEARGNETYGVPSCEKTKQFCVQTQCD